MIDWSKYGVEEKDDTGIDWAKYTTPEPVQPASTPLRGGLLGLADKTLGRFSKGLTDTYFPGVIDAQNKRMTDLGTTNPIVQRLSTEPQGFLEKGAGIAGTIAGYAAPSGLAYKAISKPAQLGYKALTKGRDLGTKGRIGLEASKGALAGGVISAGETARDEAFVPDQYTAKEHLVRGGINTLAGAALDPLIVVGGPKALGAIKKFFGKGKVKKSELAKALDDPTVPKEVKDEILLLPEGKTFMKASETPQPIQERFIDGKKNTARDVSGEYNKALEEQYQLPVTSQNRYKFNEDELRRIRSQESFMEVGKVPIPDELKGKPVLFRRDVANASLENKPHGVYLSYLSDGQNMYSPHLDVGDTNYWFEPNFKKLLNVKETRVETTARKGVDKLETSAGVQAAIDLSKNPQITKYSREQVEKLIKELDPSIDVSRYGDTWELLEVYGAQLAKRQGYDGIALRSSLPDLSEIVALSDDAIKKFDKPIAQPKTSTLRDMKLKKPSELNLNVSSRLKDNPINFTTLDKKPLEYVGRLAPMNKLKVQKGTGNNLTPKLAKKEVATSLDSTLGKKIEGNAETFRAKVSRDLKSEKKPFFKRIEEVRAKAVDDLAALEGLETRVKGSLSSAEDSLYKSARLYKGLPEKSLQIVRERLAPVVEGVEKLGYKSDDLGDYALAVHARDVHAKGIESGMTPQEIDSVIAKYGTPEMETARKELLKINNEMLESLVDGQVITRDLVDTLKAKHPNYMAMFREMDDEAVGFASGVSKALANVNSPIKGLVGSKKKIIDPLESMVKNIFQSTQAAERNKVALQLSKLSKIDSENKFIRKLGSDEAVGRKNVVSVLENGEKVKYEVEPEVYKALLNLDEQSSNILVDILSKPASVLRAGATLTPEFALRNPMRDITQAYATSKSGFNPLVDFPIAMFNVIAGKTGKGGQIYKQWLDDMGGYGNIVSMDRKVHREALEKVLKQPNSKKFINIINGKSLIGVLRSISDATESATKLGEYKAALRSGASRPEAAYRSRDVMDFARAGSSVRQVNKIVAFFNANIQGKSKVFRALKENPAGFTARAFTAVTVPTIGVFMMQKYMANDVQKQTIQDSPNWMRNTFWLIPVPGTDLVARLPKPFDLSILFSNVIERGLEYAFNNENEAFEGFVKESMGEFAVPAQITGMLPVLEGMANYSFFREGNIIPRREENLKFSDQYDTTTSGTARVLAKGAEKLTGGEGAFKNFSSPRIMDNTIKGLTAGLGTYATSFADFIAEKVQITDRPEKPKKGITQLPLAKAFLVNENQSIKALDYVYKEKEKLTKEKGSAKLNREPFKDNGKLKYLNNQTSIISDIGKRIRDIRDSRLLNPLEKKQKIDELIKRRNDIARKTEERLKK